MTAPSLLAELDAAGIHITRDGDNLRVRGNPGVRLDAFTDCIRQDKPALLIEIVQREIIAALDVEPAQFARLAYDQLVARWRRLHARSGAP